MRLLKVAAAHGQGVGKVRLKTDVFLSIFEDLLNRESDVWFHDAVREFGFVLVRSESASIVMVFDLGAPTTLV